MHNLSEITFALKEEIGMPELFAGRKKDIEYFLKWAEGVKKELNLSIALFARRKKGKTALVQRLYNVLFTQNDPMIIPFYYKVKEESKSKLELADEFYNSLICQYAAFKTRDTNLIKSNVSYSELEKIFKDDPYLLKDIKYMQYHISIEHSDAAWHHAAYAGERISSLKNERIIQILDEFQYLNQYIYTVEKGLKIDLPLCGTYHHVGASKISPVIITGSYVSWLLSILRTMTGRYTYKMLRNLPLEEAIEAVYAYSKGYNIKVTEETANYIANVTEGDVFYISRFFRTDYENQNLQNLSCIDDILFYETRTTEKEIGPIAGMWFEYLNDAIDKVNDKNGKKIILYLAKQENNEKTIKEIKEDLNLDMTDSELAKKLNAFICADIISYGQTRSRYKGLGDKMFNIVFRGMYQEEIDNLNLKEIQEDIQQQLRLLRGEVSFYKGSMAE